VGTEDPHGRGICAVPALTFHRQHDGSEDHDERLQRVGVDDGRQPPCTRARHSVRSAASSGLGHEVPIKLPTLTGTCLSPAWSCQHRGDGGLQREREGETAL